MSYNFFFWHSFVIHFYGVCGHNVLLLDFLVQNYCWWSIFFIDKTIKFESDEDTVTLYYVWHCTMYDVFVCGKATATYGWLTDSAPIVVWASLHVSLGWFCNLSKKWEDWVLHLHISYWAGPLGFFFSQFFERFGSSSGPRTAVGAEWISHPSVAVKDSFVCYGSIILLL